MSTKVSFKINKGEYIKHLELEIYRLQGQTFQLQQDIDYWKQQARKFMSRLVEVIDWYGDGDNEEDDEDDNEDDDEDNEDDEEEPIMSWRDWWRESQEEWKCWWNMGKKYR